MEAANRAAANAVQAQQGHTLVPGKKVVVIDENDTPPRKSTAKSNKEKDFYSNCPASANSRAGLLLSSLNRKILELVTPEWGLSI